MSHRKLYLYSLHFRRSFPEALFKSGGGRDPVLGNTSIREADYEVLTEFVQSFKDGLWREPEEPNGEERNH